MIADGAGDRPRLVPLEPQAVSLEDGTRGIALRDPLGVIQGIAVLSPTAYYVVAHFDGEQTPEQIAAALAADGYPVEPGEVVGMARQLREAGFVDGPTYRDLRARALARYRAAPRAASCAGGAYASDAAALRASLEAFLAHPDGPGPAAPPPSPLQLLVSPHIDYHRGGPSYAHAYAALREACDADLFVVFGTAHASPPSLFTLTTQDYATPLGAVPTDRAVVSAIASALGEETVLGDELFHAPEHSCELQMVWLRHVFAERAISAVPVLCASISHLADPAAATSPFLDALARAVAGRKVCYVAGADLAHVGPRFGDPDPIAPGALAALADEDRRTLRFLEAGDALGFHADAVRDDARRRICGVAPIFAAMRASGRSARLLHYGQWTDGVDSVSYAAAAG